MNFTNTAEFSREADHFMKYGRYCDDTPGSLAYYDYWNEQLRRCREGYSVGGVKITGNYYNFLNFTRIKKLVQDAETRKMLKVRGNQKTLGFPDFWDGHYEYFWLLDIAQHGCSKEFYEDLSLETTIKEDSLSGGKFLLVGKARRKGFSLVNASVGANAYNTIPRSYTMMLAYDSAYLYPKGIMTMAIFVFLQ